MFRLDHRFSEKTTAFVRVQHRSSRQYPTARQLRQLSSDQQQLTSAPVNGAIELLHVFSPTLVNEFKFGFNRSTANTNDINQTGHSLRRLGLRFHQSEQQPGKHRGRQLLFRNRQPDLDQRPAHGQSRSRDSAHSTEPGQHRSRNREVTLGLAAQDAFDANQVSTATLNGALPINGLRKTQYFGYIQDEFKWRPNLTLNLGRALQLLQYLSRSAGTRQSLRFRHLRTARFLRSGRQLWPAQLRRHRSAPGHSPGRPAGTTTDRGSRRLWHLPRRRPARRSEPSHQQRGLRLLVVEQERFPISAIRSIRFWRIPRASSRRATMTAAARIPTSRSGELSVQQALPADFVGTVSYVGSKGTYLLTLSEVNVVRSGHRTASLPGLRPSELARQQEQQQLQGTLGRGEAFLLARLSVLGATTCGRTKLTTAPTAAATATRWCAQNVACQACERAGRHLGCAPCLQRERRLSTSFRRGQDISEPAGTRRAPLFGSGN